MNSQGRQLSHYFDRIYVIHLPSRTDRLRGIDHELRMIGAGIDHPKVHLGCAPAPSSADGFRSIGVHGCFLSHLQMLEDALAQGFERVLILEDDAIFGRRMIAAQRRVIEELMGSSWDLCHMGHSMKGRSGGLTRLTSADHFTQLHCYAVHRRALQALITQLQLILSRPEGHPLGGKMDLDGAFDWFRKNNPEVTVLASFPALSVQRGSPSSLSERRWYDGVPIFSPGLSMARWFRDLLWRVGAPI